MNITFGVHARHPAYAAEMRHLSTAAIQYVHSIHPEVVATHHRYDAAQATIYNADRMESTWRVPCWYQRGGSVLSFSSPPIPFNRSLTVESYENVVWTATADMDALRAIQPNYFGIWLHDGVFTAWSDTLGLGRCYTVQSSKFLAVSNHIGVLAHFLDGAPVLDEVCWQQYAVFGWFVGHRTGIKGIHRVEPATTVTCEGASVRWQTYADYDALAARRDTALDHVVVADQLRVLTRNASTLMTERPRVFLSGGRDSRMTAAAWLSAGNRAVVRTTGTLAEEAVVAQRLMAIFAKTTNLDAQGVEHEVVLPKPGSVTQPIRERLANAMAYWDGDYNASCMKSNVRDSGSSSVTIGGGGGEIAHGQYYSSLKNLEEITKAPRPMDRVVGNGPWRVCMEESQKSARDFLDAESEHAAVLGRTDPSALDLFYLRQRFRRWVVAGHDTTAVVMFAAPTFVRLAFDLSPIERIERIAHHRLTRTFVPAWADVPYYKPKPEDLKQITVQGLRLWQNDDSAEHLYDTIAAGRTWPKYLRRERIEEMAGLARAGTALNAHEQWFHRVLWIEAFEQHLSRLGNLIAKTKTAC